MRVAVVSDIHGNLTALEAVLDDLRATSPDLVVHAGDLAANGSSPAEVVDIVRGLNWPGVHGNTDEMLWRPERLDELAVTAPGRQHLRKVLFHDMAPATCAALGPDRLEWLRRLPTLWTEGDLSVVHASPCDLWRAPLADASDAELVQVYSGLGTRLVAYGHIHHGYVRRIGPVTVANTGSVSLSYDGDPRAAYLVIDGDAVVVRRVTYDMDREIRRLHVARYPHASWLADVLRTGRYRPPPERDAQPAAANE